MVKPQQPGLRRSDRGATPDDAAKGHLSAPSAPGGAGVIGSVPDQNLPGPHPPIEQDKPSGRDFVAKMHALAQDDAYDAPSPEDEVLDLTQIDADGLHTGAAPKDGSGRAEVLARAAGKAAGTPLAVAGAALSAVRKRLPGS